ncbi:MAG: CBASS cGAMP synthase [Bacteroidia bacterium]|nr:CBASS cGAMP synthase [Bacteroidia bacterium]
MLPILLRILGVTVSGLVLKELFSDDEVKYTDMANSHNQFLKFEQAISLTKTRKDKLISSRQALQNRIVEYFKAKTDAPVPKFYIQGSYKMKTMVVKKDGSYDVDLGVYFLTKPTVEPLTLQKYVADAVKDQTVSGIEHREKCIRVIYKSDFDIDLPVYYKTSNDRHPFLATKTKWKESDPKELCDWFEKQRKEKDKGGQMLRLVKYFKAWANQRSGKMPSGIAFTVWVATHYKANTRDDIAFCETTKAINNSFSWEIASKNPATPGDDFLSKLDSTQKSNFKEAFKQLIRSAEQALHQDNQAQALNIWKQEFGYKFPVT